MDLLQKIWNTWKRIGQFIGDIIARIVLTVFYFTLFVPFGLIVRIWGDPLSIKPDGPGRWIDRSTRDNALPDARRLS